MTSVLQYRLNAKTQNWRWELASAYSVGWNSIDWISFISVRLIKFYYFFSFFHQTLILLLIHNATTSGNNCWREIHFKLLSNIEKPAVPSNKLLCWNNMEVVKLKDVCPAVGTRGVLHSFIFFSNTDFLNWRAYSKLPLSHKFPYQHCRKWKHCTANVTNELHTKTLSALCYKSGWI